MAALLIIDDDTELCELLAEYLGNEGFELECVNRGDAGARRAVEGTFDLVILDIMLPGLSGTEVLRRIRETSQRPVLMLTARGDDIDRIVGLELGADDYLPKPFNPRELLARIRAILRRSGNGDALPEVLQAQDLRLRPGTREVLAADRPVELTSTEFSVLQALMAHKGEVVGKDVLSRDGLGKPLGRFDRSLDMHLSNLRRKLGPAPDGGSRIETIRGVGYLLRAL